MQHDENDEWPVGDVEVERMIEACRTAFEAGDKLQLLHCLTLCARFQAVIPEWAADAQLVIWDGLRAGTIRDANEAYGVLPGRVDSRRARAKRKAVENEVMTELVRQRAAGAGIGPEFFSAVAANLQERGLGVTDRDVREVYEDHAAVIQAVERHPPTGSTFGVGNIAFSRPRRRGRPLLRD